MIFDRLSELRSTDSAPIVVPVRVNAALTTPAHLLNEVADAILAWRTNAEGFVRAALRKVLATAERVLRRALPKSASVNIDVPLAPEAKIGLELEFERDALLGTGRLLRDQLGDDLQFLRLVLRALGEALQTVAEEARVHVVVALDEFADLATAANDRSALALWRHVIESRDYQRISWLVAASRPIHDVGAYSPITNVFREYNLGPLDRAEAGRVLSAFSEPEFECAADSCRESLVAGACPTHGANALIRPVFTVDARDLLLWATGRLPYLLQVAASHCYDATVRSRVPVLTVTTCRRILAGRVIEELADFFEGQWAALRDGRSRLLEVLDGLPSRQHATAEQLRPDAWANADWSRVPPAVSKDLARLGIATADEVVPVAPLFLAWLQRHR
ncbi:MAG: hypothetical protein IT379_42065 [Deltaproteobacteria bacterium]|nr:hypothetical protein [Deltaproteobacteria bacterium]